MSDACGRRSFLKKTAAAAAAAPVLASLEERALLAQETKPAAPAPTPAPAGGAANMPCGRLGARSVSRLICGGNLISGYAHSRDLIYVSRLLRAYFTEEKIMETWALCEQQGINTMIFNPSDRQARAVYAKYRARGGRIQYIAQLAPPEDDLNTCLREAVEDGCAGVVLVGNAGDAWTRAGKTDLVAEFVAKAQAYDVPGGVAGHELRTPVACEKAGVKPDFYMKTLHSTDYWSARRPDQTQEVIDNYAADNYWCNDPAATIEFMKALARPWLAYKVLAAGALHPNTAFRYAYENGADFCVVGMFDFQVAEDARLAVKAIQDAQSRARPWRA